MGHTKTKLGRLLLLGALAASLPAAAADDIFLKLDGVRGEINEKGHEFDIDILSYTQGFTGPYARASASSGAVVGKTTCGPVTVTKYVDLSSPDLILYALNGRHIPRAVFTFRRPGQKPVEYYKVTLEDVIVTEIEQSDTKLNFPNPAPPRATEKVSLIGRSYSFEYSAVMPDGKLGAQPKAGWDCAANSKR
jgi:type VI secretion system secreted protein Hcp